MPLPIVPVRADRGIRPARAAGAAAVIRRRPRAGPRRVLAVASSGGHWVQLRRLEPAFAGHDVAYLTTHAGHRSEVAPARFYTVADANRRDPLALVRGTVKTVWVLVRERPDVVVSTGAAPGYLAIRAARLVGARTAWIDSIANVEELSLSGRMASATADLCLTQWPHLADGPVRYRGAVL
jgi:UDP-N-acetylglucosamine:LPS N-acetylglucosamine transferase